MDEHYEFETKLDANRVLQVLEALKQASHDLHHNSPESNSVNSPAIKALLELNTTISSHDPHFSTLSNLISTLQSRIDAFSSVKSRLGIRSFLTRKVNSFEISRVAEAIEGELQAWIDRESLESLTQALQKSKNDKLSFEDEEMLVRLILQFRTRVSLGFDRELQDMILKFRIFVELEDILFSSKFSMKLREESAFAVAELIKFNKDVFVGEVLMSNVVKALVSMSSPSSLKVLCSLIRSIRSPLVDEIESNCLIPKIICLLGSDNMLIRTMAFECVLEIGYFGRKEAVEAMLRERLVEKLVELQRESSRMESKMSEKSTFASCVGRFAVQLEVGEGLRQREKREFKQEVLRRVREVCVVEAEAATIIAEILWGTSP